MGSDLYIRLISASNYLKHIRPMLIRYYGRIDKSRVKSGERMWLYKADSLRHINNRSKIYKIDSNQPTKEPIQRYFPNGKQKNIYYSEIRKQFHKYQKTIYSSRNHFLRWDKNLQQIDQFQGVLNYWMKISNILQVENFCSYMQQAKRLVQQHPNCPYSTQYDDIKEAQQMFTYCYQKMKKKQEETYLILDVGH